MSVFIRQQKEAAIQIAQAMAKLKKDVGDFATRSWDNCEHRDKEYASKCTHPDYVHPADSLNAALWERPLHTCNPKHCPYGKG